MSRPAKRSLAINGHRTSVSLEPEFWAALGDIAKAEGIALAELVQRIDRRRVTLDQQGGLSTAIRLDVLSHYRRLAARAAGEPVG
jgi:predicted DNA-binding ribbon-helix-helix protein